VLDGDVLLALAARVGETRLIDNMSLSVHGAEASADLGIRSEGAICTVRTERSHGRRSEGAICDAR
jgi:hypothetical protein